LSNARVRRHSGRKSENACDEETDQTG
jgi:hypothetical protein